MNRRPAVNAPRFPTYQGATVVPPHSSGSTSRTVWVSSRRTGERLVDVRYAHLDQVGCAAAIRRHPLPADLRDHDSESPIRTRSAKPNAASNHVTAARTSG
jgi:hypothetical protein